MELTPRKIALHLGLFVVTFVTTTLAGSEWVHGKSILVPGYTWTDFLQGMSYSIPFLFILSVHEFGHYFTAIHYRIRTTLPYYIPLPPFPFMIGTLGALIRMKSRVPSRQQTFDVGIAGPLAGLVATVGVLVYGFATLPPPEYVFQFHPSYEAYGLNYAQVVYSREFLAAGAADIVIGKNLLYLLLEQWVADPARIPNVHEIIHYPYLFAGFLSLVVTSINLLPVGQLDGGHVVYGLLGYEKHRRVAYAFFMLFVLYAGMGTIRLVGPDQDPWWYALLFVGFLYLTLTGLSLPWQSTLMYALIIFVAQVLLTWALPEVKGYTSWLVFAFIVGRFVGVDHPPCLVEEPISPWRRWLGWFAILVFVLTFSPAPLNVIIYPPTTP